MTTFVLIPGAWLGASAWDTVANRLRTRGHQVLPLSLPGLGERAGEASPQIDFESYVGDVTGRITRERLGGAILVGHSFGGAVAAGVADRIPDRLAHLVYVDAGPPPSGSSYLDMLAPPQVEFVTDMIAGRGDGWLVPFPTWDELETRLQTSLDGLGEPERAALRASARPQPAATWTQQLHRDRSAATAAVPKTLVACSFPLAQVRELIAAGHPWFAELAGPEWSFLELSTGHWPMFSRPNDLADLLADLPDPERADSQPTADRMR